jgi:hypothetical protein
VPLNEACAFPLLRACRWAAFLRSVLNLTFVAGSETDKSVHKLAAFVCRASLKGCPAAGRISTPLGQLPDAKDLPEGYPNASSAAYA